MKGKGKGGVSLAGEMPGKAESKPAESKPAGMSGGRDKIRVVGAHRIWGTLKNSTAASIKSVVSRLCKVRYV